MEPPRPGVLEQGLPTGSLPDAATVIGTAAWTGIVGNIAYDAIKAGLKRLLGRRQHRRLAKGESQGNSDRAVLARLAVQNRCAELGLPGPGSDELGQMFWVIEETTHTCYLSFERVYAIVRMPAGKLDRQQLEVTVYTQSKQDSP